VVCYRRELQVVAATPPSSRPRRCARAGPGRAGHRVEGKAHVESVLAGVACGGFRIHAGSDDGLGDAGLAQRVGQAGPAEGAACIPSDQERLTAGRRRGPAAPMTEPYPACYSERNASEQVIRRPAWLAWTAVLAFRVLLHAGCSYCWSWCCPPEGRPRWSGSTSRTANLGVAQTRFHE
jgi:hypothetical protein